MTTYYRPRYAESDAVWADLHGELAATYPAPGELCPTHGPYTPRGLLDGDCPHCEAAAHTERIAALARRWASPEWHDRADAYHEVHD